MNNLMPWLWVSLGALIIGVIARLIQQAQIPGLWWEATPLASAMIVVGGLGTAVFGILRIVTH